MATKRDPSDDAKELSGRPFLTRRDLLEFVGLAIAAGALPSQMLSAARPMRGAQQNVSSIMETLSAYMSAAASRTLPDHPDIGRATRARGPVQSGPAPAAACGARCRRTRKDKRRRYRWQRDWLARADAGSIAEC